MNKIFASLLVLSFVLSACAPVTPVTTPTVEPLPVAPTLSNIPHLVAQSPQAGERLPLKPRIELTFDRSMDSAATEAALTFAPMEGESIPGTISWPDPRTLRFTPDVELVPATKYVLSLAASAASAEGVTLDSAIRLEFQTVEALAVAQVFPAPDSQNVNLDTAITVIFNQPVVPLTIAEEQANLPQPLTIQPAVQGHGEWVSSSVYVFQPEKPFHSGTSYLVSVDAGIKDAQGTLLGESYVWKFVTRAPRIDTLSLVNGETNPPLDLQNVLLDQAFLITFLQPMDRPSTEAAVTLKERDSGRAFPVRFKWNDDSTALTILPVGHYRVSGYYQLELGKTALAQDGSPLADGLTFRFSTLPLPHIVRVTPAPHSSEKYFSDLITIKFSSPMDFDTLKSRVVISPQPKGDLRMYYNEYDWELNIFGLEPSTDYIVRLLPGMRDIYGNPINTEYSWDFKSGSLYPTANLVIPGTLIYRPHGDQSFFFEYTNLQFAEISLYPISPEDFLRMQRGEISMTDFTPQGQPLRTWNPDLNVPRNQFQRAELSLKDESGNPLSPGYYFIGLKAKPFAFSRFLQGATIIVASENLTLKTTDSEALAWLTDLETGRPVSGVPILFLDDSGKQIGKVTTDADGLAYLSGMGNAHLFYARTDDKNHIAFTSQDWGSGVSPFSFGIDWNYWTPSKAPFGFVYTERPIYRPNQDVFFKGIVRQNDDLHYSLPERKSVYVTISFAGETLYEQELALNEMGTFSGVFHLAEEAALGSYDLSLKFSRSDETPFAYHSFRVAEYRKPEFQVTAAPNVTDVLAGDSYTLSLDAAYYSGGFVGSGQVSWFLSASPADFQPAPEYSSFSFADYDYDLFRPEPFPPVITLEEGKATLDENGHLELSQTARLEKYKNGSQVTFSANVTDVAGNLVSGGTSLHVHPSLIYAGIRSQSYVGNEGLPAAFDLVVLDWQSQPIPNQPLTVEIIRREWFSVQQKDENGTLRWVTSVKDTPVTTLNATTDAEGRASVSFTPQQGGVYKAVVKVQDSHGNTQQASQFIWVAGREYIPWQQTNDRSFRLVTDKPSYQVGDTAKILIAQPFEGKHYALLTYERGHIYEKKVILLDGNSTVYELPITKEMAPVAYISVVVIKGAESDSPPDFRVGMARLNVDLAQQQLTVTLQADKESAGPNEKVTYTVTVKDYAGKPVQAELSLALVDKAVLALVPPNSPPILSAFYPQRALSVFTSLGLVFSADQFNASYRQSAITGQGGGSGGGKGEGDLGVVTVRQNFRDTAYWEAQVKTDAQGQARLTVTLPENLTTWQMKARAVTADSRVGEATHDLVSTKPLHVEMQSPRFFIAGDTARVGAIVHNNTRAPLNVQVRLEAEGVEINSSAKQTVRVGAGQQAYVTWDVKVHSGVSRVDFTVHAASGAFEDASKPAVGTLAGQGIPVYTFHVTEPVGTSGVIRDATSLTEAIQLPTSLPFKNPQVHLELSPSLAASMIGGLNALEDFEYLCMEQTISRFLPNVAAVRALDLAGQPSTELRARLDKQVGTSLQRIYAKQLPNGGWAWWDGKNSDPQVTAYVLLGLLEARGAGYNIHQDTFDRAVEYLKNNLPKLSPNDAVWKYNRQAFITYVLARAGEFPTYAAQNLFENRSHLGTYGQAYLAQAFFLDNPQASRVKTLMADLVGSAVLSAAGAHWEEKEADFWNWNTDLRTTAITLDAFVRIQPESPLTVDGVRWLMAHRHPDGWGSTQETAWTLLALTDWLVISKEFSANYTYAVGLNGESLQQGQMTQANLTTPTQLTISGEQLSQQVNYLVITRGAGTGNLYYTAYLQTELPVNEVAALDRGIIVSRQYFTLDNPKKPITRIRRGELVRVQVTIVAPAALHYVVVNDPLPAGLEAVDASLLTDPQVPEKYSVTDFSRRGWGWWFFNHIERRDEKVVLSADYLPAGTYVFTYLARASAAGTFNVIPTTAAEFYFPDVYGRGQGSVFVVEP